VKALSLRFVCAALELGADEVQFAALGNKGPSHVELVRLSSVFSLPRAASAAGKKRWGLLSDRQEYDFRIQPV
jgi:hypothetical protein